jgi:hypothetical protein
MQKKCGEESVQAIACGGAKNASDPGLAHGDISFVEKIYSLFHTRR